MYISLFDHPNCQLTLRYIKELENWTSRIVTYFMQTYFKVGWCYIFYLLTKKSFSIRLQIFLFRCLDNEWLIWKFGEFTRIQKWRIYNYVILSLLWNLTHTHFLHSKNKDFILIMIMNFNYTLPQCTIR